MKSAADDKNLEKLDVQELSRRLVELEEILHAIRHGEVDAVVVSAATGDRVFTLQGAEHPYRVLVESMNEGAATLTADGTILYANRRFAQMLEARLEQLIGSSLLSVVTAPDGCDLRTMLKQATDAPQTIECLLQLANGDCLPAHLSFGPLEGDDVKAISLIATDLGEQKRRELELAEINQKLAREVQQRMRAEEAVRRDEESLRQLSARLLQLQDEERRRIARDLHDSTGQKLVGLSLELTMAAQHSGSLPPAVHKAITNCCFLADEISSDIRTLSYLLHPPLLDEVGLLSAARWFVDGFVRRSNIRVEVQAPQNLERMPQELELTLFRLLQESLTNVHRHSGSPTAEVVFTVAQDEITLEVKDQGTKPLKQDMESGNKMGEMMGVGIRGMRERVRQLGGHLNLCSDGHGTTMKATLPLRLLNRTSPATRTGESLSA
jgi:PAS domain S-box-containing protein